MTCFKLKLILLVGFLLAAIAPAALQAGEIYSATVVKVSDGDTIHVMKKDGHKVKIRLYGIDAPEKQQAFGRVSRDHLQKLLRSRAVSVEPLYQDKYRRTVALVWLGTSRLVNEIMVDNGLAWHYPQYCKKQPLCKNIKRKEQIARREKRGLWKDKKKPVPPWAWRKR